MVPIPIYAVLGHLASGLVILAACEAAFDGKWLIDRQWTPGAIGLCGITAYFLGRLFAALSRLVFERGVVRIPDRIRDHASQQAGIDGFNGARHILFLEARSAVEQDGATRNRLETLLQMSRICRTMCLALLVVAAILVSGIFWHGFSSRWSQAEWRKFGYCALSLIESAGMLHRYLKYLRQHAAEVFGFFVEMTM